MNGKEVGTLIQALQQNQFNLGMSWELRPGTVDSVLNGVTYVLLDGSENPNIAIQMGTAVGKGIRVYCLITSPTSIFVVGSQPSVGSAVLRVRQTVAQSIPDAGSGTFLTFDTLDLDVFNVVEITGSPTDFLMPVPGWYMASGRGVFASNAVSRRGFFINLNATTAAPGTVGGQSLQAPATGSAQISGQGLVYMNGITDFIGARVIQNSGAPLNTASTDGGSVLEMTYLGGPLEA